MQKKCGACAMVINNRPRLACDTPLKEFKAGSSKLNRSGKFPVIADLIVDRSILFENLRTMQIWFAETRKTNGSQTAYEASRCLQCGCCLEICPNFFAGGEFSGMSAMIPDIKTTHGSAGISEKRDLSKLIRNISTRDAENHWPAGTSARPESKLINCSSIPMPPPSGNGNSPNMRNKKILPMLCWYSCILLTGCSPPETALRSPAGFEHLFHQF